MMEDDVRFSFQSRVFLSVLIALVGLVVLEAGQTLASFYDHGDLLAVRAGQNASVAQSARLRQQLTTLAGGVAQLAQSGDADAQSIVAQFAKNGVKFSPPSQPAGAGK